MSVGLFGGVTYANSKQEFDIVKSKQELADKYKDNFIQMTEKEAKERAEKIDKEILEMTALGKSDQEMDVALAKYKVYRLITPKKDSFSPMSISGNVNLNNVYIYYDSGASQWVLSGGGYWNSDSAWKNDAPLWAQAMCPVSFDLGGEEVVGISLHNTSGPYTASMVSGMAYYSNGSDPGHYIYNASNNNYEQGISFKYQDYIEDPTPSDMNWDEWKYTGRHFSALARYTSSFSDYSGNANTFCGHTWDGVISTITLGNSGASITFSVTEKSWPAYDVDVAF